MPLGERKYRFTKADPCEAVLVKNSKKTKKIDTSEIDNILKSRDNNHHDASQG